MNTPLASVIVCTYNRCDSLRETLEALAAQQVPPGFEWELLVVNNNSRDATEQVIREFQQRQPNLRCQYIFEGQQGLSAARNAGLTAARGEYLVFTDDDVLPAPDWLATLVNGMREHRCGAAGGYIEPLWLGPRPAWLTERFYGFLALRTDPEGPKEARDAEDMPFGANMAFRRDTLERVGLFDTQLGRKGNQLAGGEEIDMLMRVVSLGLKVMYLPAARVRHKVEAFRLHRSYFRRWRYEGSRNEGLRQGVPAGRTLFGVPLYLYPQLARSMARTLAMKLTRPADEAFRQEMITWHFLGLMRGMAQRASR